MLKAVIFDYDGTLTSKSMPEFEILEKSGLKGGIDNPKFFTLTSEVMRREQVSIYEALFRVLLDTVKNAGFRLTNENLAMGVRERVHNPGVEEFLQNLKERGVKTYLLSSGLRVYLERIKIASCFEDIYATTLSYDRNGEVNGTEHVMSDAEKTVTLQEIAQRANGDAGDFSGIVYVGDGPTDVKAMQYVRERGGKAILVQQEELKDRPQVDPRFVDLVAMPDFTSEGEIVTYLENLI